MAEGKDRAAWNHTAALIANLRNANKGPKQAADHPADFHPYLTKKERKKAKANKNRTARGLPITPATIHRLKMAFNLDKPPK